MAAPDRAGGITDFPFAPEGPLIKAAAVPEKNAVATGESALELLRAGRNRGILAVLHRFYLLMLQKRRSKRAIGGMAVDGSSSRISSRPSVSPGNAGILDFGTMDAGKTRRWE